MFVLSAKNSAFDQVMDCSHSNRDTKTQAIQAKQSGPLRGYDRYEKNKYPKHRGRAAGGHTLGGVSVVSSTASQFELVIETGFFDVVF